mgnify:CR=1 FL=1
MDWFLDAGRRAPHGLRRDRASCSSQAAGVLGAHHIKVGNIPGTPASSRSSTERFGELCADAAERTDAKIVYELMPFDVERQEHRRRARGRRRRGRRNGGIAIDTWHMSKLGIAPDELRRIPLEYLSWVELSDGQFDDMDDPIDETINHRDAARRGRVRHRAAYVERLPWITATPARGASRCSPRSCATDPIDVIFRRAYETTAAQFGSARGAPR